MAGLLVIRECSLRTSSVSGGARGGGRATDGLGVRVSGRKKPLPIPRVDRGHNDAEGKKQRKERAWK